MRKDFMKYKWLQIQRDNILPSLLEYDDISRGYLGWLECLFPSSINFSSLEQTMFLIIINLGITLCCMLHQMKRMEKKQNSELDHIS
jgi:hypothetical protein